MDQDALIYKGLGTALSLITLKKLIDFYGQIGQNIQHEEMKISLMKKSDENIKCPVCFDTLEGVSFASIKCGHVYCWHCISRWMKSEKNCPVCRQACDPPDLIPLANI